MSRKFGKTKPWYFMVEIQLKSLEIVSAGQSGPMCLAIFFALIWYQRLTWTYSAETLSIACGPISEGGVTK